MSLLNNAVEKLHVIRVRLYPNYLQSTGVEGEYIARTNSEASLSIEQVCAALKNRGGYTGNFEELQENIRQFFDEAAYQLCDGFAVNMKYFSIHPNISGTFNSVSEARDSKKHPITFRFRAQSPLRRLVNFIEVLVEGLAETSGWIDEFEDAESHSINTFFTPGNLFILHGDKIKIAGDDPACGLYFVPVEDPAKAVKVTRIAENNPSRIIGIAPETNCLRNKIEIRTQATNSSAIFLKKIRIITSNFEVEES
jgi:hypothetical protein